MAYPYLTVGTVYPEQKRNSACIFTANLLKVHFRIKHTVSTTAASKASHTFSFTEQYSVWINNSFLARYILVYLKLLYLVTLMIDGEMIGPFISPTQAKRQRKKFPYHVGLYMLYSQSNWRVQIPPLIWYRARSFETVWVLYSVHSVYRHKHNYTSNRL